MKSIFSTLLLFGSLSIFGQSIAGTAVFASESASMFSFDSTSQMSQQEQAAINEQIQQAMRKEYRLTFNAAEGLYQQIPKLAAPSAEKEVEVIGGGQGMDGGIYKNTRKSLLVETRDVFGKLFLIKDSLVRPEWTILEEQKVIQGYTCIKAELKAKRGKSTAWFTPEIPVNLGPGDFWGLPGFILQVNTGRMKITCTELKINAGTAAVIVPPKKGKEITLEEYKKIYSKKIEEMNRMYDDEGNR
ncbi:MAG: GLPGLI family protein [Lewinella sp.]